MDEIVVRFKAYGDRTVWAVEGSTEAFVGAPPVVGEMTEHGLVKEVIDDLPVVAGYLPTIEQLDPRRVYTTDFGTSVVFKRVENGRVILWSYKNSGEVAVGTAFNVVPTDRHAEPIAMPDQRMTQKILAAYLIAQNPAITKQDLAVELKKSFPAARIGDRHGQHYLSLSRSGRLPEAPADDPRGWKVT